MLVFDHGQGSSVCITDEMRQRDIGGATPMPSGSWDENSVNRSYSQSYFVYMEWEAGDFRELFFEL